MPFLIAIDGVPNLDDDLVQRLARTTRRPEGEWRKTLIAPALPRVVLAARTDADARSIMERLQSCGLVPHVVPQDDVVNALEGAFEATWAEPERDGVIFIGADGRDLRVDSGSMRLVVTGQQLVQGEHRHFCVIGLRNDDPGAIIIKIPGAELSKIVQHAEDPPDVLEALVAFLQKKAPHVVVERGLDKHTGRMSGLDEVGTSDFAHAGVIAMWLLRKFPPQAHAPRRPGPHDIVDSPFHAAPPEPAAPSIDVAVDHRRAMRDLASSIPEAQSAQDMPMPSRPRTQETRVSWRDTIRTPEEQARRKRMQMAAGVIGIVAAAAVAFAVLHTPAQVQHLVKLHEAWKTPYGPTITYADSYDAGFGDVHDPGFVLDFEKSGDHQTIRVSGHDSKDGALRDGLGMKFRVTSFEDTGSGRAAWISIEAKRP